MGGPDTHCVVSGHRGLPSAKLFTNLDQLEAGDLFLLHVLDETLAYEVDQIHIVEPEDTSLLEIEEGQDLCTLVTCTPYGINSHRLLVRGHRVETPDGFSAARVPGDAMQIEPLVTAPFLAVPVLLILLIWLLAGGRRKDGAGSAEKKKRGGRKPPETGNQNLAGDQKDHSIRRKLQQRRYGPYAGTAAGLPARDGG